MRLDRAHEALRAALPPGRVVETVGPVPGSHWQAEASMSNGGRDTRVRIRATSFGAALDAASSCSAVTTLVARHVTAGRSIGAALHFGPDR